MTYVRIPTSASPAGSLPLDNRVLKINRVRLCRMSVSSFIWVDDPDNPLLEHWRRSSRARSIRRMTSNTSKDAPEARAPCVWRATRSR
ncbi:hypothetical protein GCM10009798_34660 [Nocardioides panacihumi]|uniref:Uncharacterized protein n=1 Tax=Nocardioides panacihumi TaxID=400774 RepID=A0ABN2RLX5_9ACTN